MGTLIRMRLRWLDGLVLFYGIVLILAGVDGFIHKSIISLVAGGTCGIVEIVFALIASSKPRVARIGAAIISLLIMGKFVPDALKKHSKVAFVLAALSLLVFVCLLGGHFYAMSKRKASA